MLLSFLSGKSTHVQVAVIEYARTILGWTHAHSAEFNPDCEHPVVIFMPEGSQTHMGGTMRLGSRATVLQTHDSHAAKLYRPADNKVHERHRHRCVHFSAMGIISCDIFLVCR